MISVYIVKYVAQKKIQLLIFNILYELNRTNQLSCTVYKLFMPCNTSRLKLTKKALKIFFWKKLKASYP